ncbi:MAG: histone-like nucleoid-structuring protein Lsr2 [Marmoricola sp.]
MAQKVNIILVDDIDGSEAEETVPFALDGEKYAIDLNAKNAKKLRDAIAPYVAHARKETSVRGRRRSSRRSGGVSTADVRAWARDNGYRVSERGRISAEVQQAFEAAH